ncbi:MAG: TerC family protein [Candidatus Fonsibacter lacus]|jgi:YjbE family integral membrane protein|uniref:TerC family protein n=1 Tax=Candidatus Fonsibacter lacus TaxID=2576439 RepID=A0A845SAF4_9PROT|nr:TerC family protein [Candidatus Fonsibacter lacus]NCU73964.1 TerC family protein [Candidatus Fonsibacter lacus]
MEFFADDLRLTIKIILIDMILSADNAIVIGLFASQFDPKIRQKVLVIGTSLAVLFRILFAVLVAYFLQYKGVRTFGAILLFYIAYKLYGDILKDNSEKQLKIKKSQLIKENDKKNYWKAIFAIIVVDLNISFDNVIAVSGAAKSNYTLLIFGLTLSIIMMITLANAISKYLKEHKWVGWLGILSILWVAVDLIRDDFKLFF